ncbi:MAG: Uma2 family endonuclease [Chloroflexi bacterium]|nr:Uma2 family endonuclease [Chloroflexota bacterium]
MAVQSRRYTVEEFDQWVMLPENTNRRFEYIGGEIVEVVSNNYSSAVGALILAEIVVYVKRQKLGYVTSADGGYRVAGERYIPDVGFISNARQPQPSHEAYNSNAPDLAVEVLSPTDQPDEMRVKVINYLAAGTTVWIVDPARKRVEVYTAGPRVRMVNEDGMLDGGSVLPGFRLAVKDIFPD